MSGIFYLLIPLNSFDHYHLYTSCLMLMYKVCGQEIIMINEESTLYQEKIELFLVDVGQCKVSSCCVFQEVHKVLWYFWKGCSNFGT